MYEFKNLSPEEVDSSTPEALAHSILIDQAFDDVYICENYTFSKLKTMPRFAIETLIDSRKPKPKQRPQEAAKTSQATQVSTTVEKTPLVPSQRAAKYQPRLPTPRLRAMLWFNGRAVHVGYFETEAQRDAALALGRERIAKGLHPRNDSDTPQWLR